MDDWRRGVEQYQQGIQSIASSNLAEKESLLQGRASLISGQIGQDEAMTGQTFADKLAEEGQKFMGTMGVELGGQPTIATALRGISGLMKYRGRVLNSRWKTTQAERFNEQERAQGRGEPDIQMDDIDLEPEPGMPGGAPQTLFEGAPARPGSLAGGRASLRPTQAPDDGNVPVADEDYVASGGRRALTQNVGDHFTDDSGPDGLAPQDTALGGDAEGGFVDAFATPYTDSLPSYARGVGRMGNALRQYARSGGYSGSATSDNIGDAINQARGGDPPEPEAPQGRPKFTTAEDDEFGDEPFGQEFGLRGDVRPLGETEIGMRTPQTLQETEPATGDVPELPKITVQDVSEETDQLGDQAQNITQQATTEAQNVAQTAEEEAGGVVEDLAPEITQASSAWATAGGYLADAIPVVGFGLGLWGLISGSEDIADKIKDEDSDPYASLRPKLAQAQQQISSLQNTVSADEFASKIGARAPQFGSLAVGPVMDTAKQQGIALHV